MRDRLSYSFCNEFAAPSSPSPLRGGIKGVFGPDRKVTFQPG